MPVGFFDLRKRPVSDEKRSESKSNNISGLFLCVIRRVEKDSLVFNVPNDLNL